MRLIKEDIPQDLIWKATSALHHAALNWKYFRDVVPDYLLTLGSFSIARARMIRQQLERGFFWAKTGKIFKENNKNTQKEKFLQKWIIVSYTGLLQLMITFLVLHIPVFKPHKTLIFIYSHSEKAVTITLPAHTHGWTRFEGRQIIEKSH